MNEKRALALAPFAIFPVALVFVAARSLLAGDLRELFAAPFSAMMITAVGYLFAIAGGWFVMRTMPRLVDKNPGIVMGVGALSAEICFWLFIQPFWQRDFSNFFCTAMVAACGAATAGLLRKLRKRANSR